MMRVRVVMSALLLAFFGLACFAGATALLLSIVPRAEVHMTSGKVLAGALVALGIGAFVALVGFADSFEEQWRQFYRTKGTDICVFRGSFMNKASTDESLGQRLRAFRW